MQRTIGKRGQALTWLVILFVACAIFIGDFFIKNYLKNSYAWQSIPVIPNIFSITVIFNKGAAFGIFQGRVLFLILITLALIGMFIYFIFTENDFRPFSLAAYGMILGGALSNFYDRVFIGYVVDYLDFHIWPVFNLSDSCICIGVGILIVQSLRKQKQDAISNKRI